MIRAQPGILKTPNTVFCVADVYGRSRIETGP